MMRFQLRSMALYFLASIGNCVLMSSEVNIGSKYIQSLYTVYPFIANCVYTLL